MKRKSITNKTGGDPGGATLPEIDRGKREPTAPRELPTGLSKKASGKQQKRQNPRKHTKKR